MMNKKVLIIAFAAFALGFAAGFLLQVNRVKQEQLCMSGLVRAVDIMLLGSDHDNSFTGKTLTTIYPLNSGLRAIF